MKPIIRVENLGKQYRIGRREVRYATLRESLVQAAVSPINRLRRALNPNGNGSTDSERHIWALKDVGFEVKPGEVVGIIGRNGAGKSTLLKILSRVTEPTEGKVDLYGRVGSLLEVGTGFHPELTGRENIYLNGAILGMSRREISRNLDAIIAFAEIEKFADTPVKRYSSGMYLRLAFAVAAHLEPEILLVDEVLAVGDATFQKKCLGKMQDVSQQGRTVLFVSHNMAAVENLCKRTIWIADGQVKQDGDTREVIRAYLNSFDATDKQTTDLAAVREREGTGDVRFLKMEFLNESGGEEPVIHSGCRLHIRFHYECQRDMRDLYFGLRIFSNLGVLISDVHNWATNQAIPLAPKGRGTIDLEIDFLNLIPGTYYAGLWAATSGTWHDVLDKFARFDVQPTDFYGTGRGLESQVAGVTGLVFFPYRWSVPGNALSGPAETSAAPTASTLVHPDNNRTELLNF